MTIRILVFSLFLALSPALPAQVLQPPRDKTAPAYVIQPNDILEIFVYREPLLSRKVLVRPDGRISFPLIQDLQAAGMNPTDLKRKIEEDLKQYMDAPNVTVIVDAIQSYKIYVTGRVARPGVIMSEKPISVLQAIALSGGFVEFANTAETIIIRNSGEDSRLFRFNYPEAIKGMNFSQNMLLRSGDVVVVP